MDKQNNNPQQQNDNWLDEILGASQLPDEIQPDHDAISAAGLTHPDDAELEKIIRETKEEEQSDEDAEPTQIFTAPAPEELPAVQETAITESASQEAVPAEAPAAPAKPVNLRKPPRVKKRRPKMKKGYGLWGLPHLVSTAVWLGIILIVGVTLGRVVWVCTSDLMAFGKPDMEVTITITETDDLESICKKLGDANLVRYPQLFKLFADLTGKYEDISVGTFTLNAMYDYNAMINAMGSYSPAREEVKVVVPEGYNCAQIFQLLEDEGVCTAEELENWAKSGELDDYWFLEGVPRGHKYCLEGFMFPDTYLFYTNDEPRRVLEKFLDDFDYRFTSRMQDQFEALQIRFADMMASNGYGSDYIEENKLTLYDVVILASIVEKETANDSESFTIASVFYNRLANLGAHPFLGSDATILYATDYYNKGELITDEQINESPFNTYTHIGLIPSPISNPGANSLYAALSPEDTEYYYFLYDENIGEHRFSKTLRQHEDWYEKLYGE